MSPDQFPPSFRTIRAMRRSRTGEGTSLPLELGRRSHEATIILVASAVPGQQSIVVDPKSPGSINSPHGLILFDGVCVLCSRGCGFVSKRDCHAYFCIACSEH